MREITVYTKPKDMGYCAQCVATVRRLNTNGTEHTEANIYADESAEILNRAQLEGISSAPVVHVREGDQDYLFGGYRPDLLDELV